MVLVGKKLSNHINAPRAPGPANLDVMVRKHLAILGLGEIVQYKVSCMALDVRFGLDVTTTALWPAKGLCGHQNAGRIRDCSAEFHRSKIQLYFARPDAGK